MLEPEEAIRFLGDLTPALHAELPGLPLTREGQRLIIVGPPPRLGEHTAEILQGIRIEPIDLEDLARRGIIRAQELRNFPSLGIFGSNARPPQPLLRSRTSVPLLLTDELQL
ncbi:MAG: hypothetical protein RMK32_01980 [Anaerolineae bacterium]|nr:hypothetical protein [Anaerolineae bacterium]